MKRKLFWVLCPVLALTLIGLVGCSTGATTIDSLQLGNQQTGIWINGTGKVTVEPDIANLSLGIEAQADTVAEAQAQAYEAMDKIMEALKDNGVKENDIQTRHFNIQKETRWDSLKEEEVVTGYRVSNMVTAKIREIDKVGAIIDAAVAAGGDLTRVNGINFSIDDPSEYYEEARIKAVADAEATAKNLAELAGVSLGKPTYISEYASTPPIIYRDVMYEAAAPVPAPAPTTSISAGELEVSITVQMAYAIK